MQVEESFLADKFRQLKAENERLKVEIDSYRTRLGNATEDYVGAVKEWWPSTATMYASACKQAMI
jgi:hypothetical protein